jgi:hypothetical protein
MLFNRSDFKPDAKKYILIKSIGRNEITVYLKINAKANNTPAKNNLGNECFTSFCSNNKTVKAKGRLSMPSACNVCQ